MKIVHNTNYYNPNEEYPVKCLKYKKDATVTIFYRSTQLCKTDIQLTPIKSRWKCSLWENDIFPCIECPYLQK